jgi:hypothetical protein
LSNSAAFPSNPAAQVGNLLPPGASNPLTPGAPTVLSTPNLLLTSATGVLAGQGPIQTPSFAIPTGFPGRLLFPTTGVSVRTPNGDGPMQAPPGVFAPGGGDQTQPATQTPATPRPLAPATPIPGRIDFDLGGADMPVNATLDQQSPDARSADQDDLDFTVDPVVNEQPEP